VPLLKRSYRLFSELEVESGQKLFQRTGMLDIGPGPVFQVIEHACHGFSLSISDTVWKCDMCVAAARMGAPSLHRVLVAVCPLFLL
jgi:hypothetical protein